MLVFAVLCALAVAIESASVGHPETYTSRAKRCACEVPHDDDHDDMHQENAERLDEMDLTLNRLIAKAQHLADEFEHMVHEREEAATKADSLKLRIAKKDEVCPKGQFRCLSSGIQCVADLLVCDGHKDCDDGSDEDEHVCTKKFEAHTTWQADIVFDHCFPFKSDYLEFTITHERIDPHFPSRVELLALNLQKSNTKDLSYVNSMTFKGYYYFAHQMSLWYSVDDPQLYWRCYFDDETSYMACYAYRNTFDEPCAKYFSHQIDLNRSAISRAAHEFGAEFNFSNV